MLASDDVPVSGGGDEQVGARSSLLHSSDFITSHSSLQGIDRVDLSDKDTSTV